MRKIKSILMLLFLLISGVSKAQLIEGTIVDETGPIPGVNIYIKGTTNGVSTDFDGKFVLNSKEKSGEVVISFVGYLVKVIPFNNISSNKTLNLGSIVLKSSSVGLNEVLVVASYAIGRKTPIAVSTVGAKFIETKLGNQELPEILKSTPGIYATKQGGGFGDASVKIRGFDSENVAVLINGIPVNDMENGKVYWSNWAGLADVTSSMQVQRGLGASKVAVPSIGGTINIITKTTDAEKGGFISYSMGNDGYQKSTFKVSTGLNDNGFAATILGSKISGEGFVDGTEFEGYSYFMNLSKIFNEKHTLTFTLFGAKQRHGQRQNKSTIETYRLNENGIKYNPDWGYKNGQVTHIEDNFYNKPQASLNHYWTIDETTSLSTILYASKGTGGGGGTAGDESNNFNTYRLGEGQPVDIDRIVNENIENGSNTGALAYLRASRNDHTWTGFLSTLDKDITDEFKLLAGLDLRYYKGVHFSEVTDLLGAAFAVDSGDINNPDNIVKVGDKRSYYNDGIVGWTGVFLQGEYSKDDLSIFVSTAASRTSYKRIDYFNYLDSDPLRETDFQNFIGYSIKGGANYNIDDSHNVFFNGGYFEKAPNFSAVFLNYKNDINEGVKNQGIFSLELGYGFRSEKFSANVNVYRTQWKDRFLRQSFDGTYDNGTPDDDSDDIDYDLSVNLSGVDAIHQGVELDFKYKPFDKLNITGMLSIGDWRWANNLTDVPVFNEDQVQVAEFDLFIKDLKVGAAAQTTLALGVDYKILPTTNVFVDYNYYASLYADFDPNTRTTADSEGVDSWKVPDFGLVDLGLNHNFEFGNMDARLNIKVNNLFDTEYISDAQDGTTSSVLVWYGAGRTYSMGLKINF